MFLFRRYVREGRDILKRIARRFDRKGTRAAEIRCEGDTSRRSARELFDAVGAAAILRYIHIVRAIDRDPKRGEKAVGEGELRADRIESLDRSGAAVYHVENVRPIER